MKMNPASPPTRRPAAPAATAQTTNSVLARALFSLWSGDPIMVVKSPPGAGKTSLVTGLAHALQTRAGQVVAIAAQTRAQAFDVASRTAALGGRVLFLDAAGAERPAALHHDVALVGSSDVLPRRNAVVVATSARWQWIDTNRFHADILFVDEAYQMTLGDLSGLMPLADQLALVGDPGQIPPVITASTRRWAHQPGGPHVPAPTAIEYHFPQETTLLHLPQTWRLGPATTALIQDLYEVPFTSARQDRHLEVMGVPLAEFAASITSATSPMDPALSLASADAARALLNSTVVTVDGRHALTPGEIAVVTPHVDQAALVAAALADLPEIFVGTINQAQGLEREAVVAIHPLAGHANLTSASLDTGRLCVALSRHRSHLTVITETGTPSMLAAALTEDPGNTAALAHQSILDRLILGS